MKNIPSLILAAALMGLPLWNAQAQQAGELQIPGYNAVSEADSSTAVQDSIRCRMGNKISVAGIGSPMQDSVSPMADSRIAWQSNGISLYTNGMVAVSADTLTAPNDSAAVFAAAFNSPYAPKTPVFNDKEAPVRVSMTKEKKGEREVENWFLMIPDSIMGRLFLSSTNLSQTPPQFQFVQQQVNEGLFSFVLSQDKKYVYLKDYSSWIDVDSLDAISKAVDISNAHPIVARLKVESEEGGVYKVNANSILLSESVMTITPSVKSGYRISQIDPSRSTINSVHCYPQNIEINTTRTYPTQHVTELYTVGLNTSLILLPKTPMQRRLYDPRIGLRAIDATHFADNQQKVETTLMLTRWRMEPKNAEDAALQKNGTPIEPKKPIVYYIDPAFPAKWIPYVKEGVAEWQRSFERAGWKNAIYALDWPKNDSTISFEDKRYNIIRFIPSAMRYVFGNPRVWDYRSGEFLNTYILFCSGAITEMRSNYVVQCGAVDDDAHAPVLPDQLMGSLIRHAIAKAIAPTIGLQNNNLASGLTPTDSLRSRAFVQKYGMAPSISDELPYNYVAQPGDGLTRDELIPRVGDGDDWTVMLGYKNFGFDDPEQERQYICQMLTDSIAANPRLQFAVKGGGINDYLCKENDLGDDQVKAISYFWDNLKRITPQLDKWAANVKDFANNNTVLYGYWNTVNNSLTIVDVILANNLSGYRYYALPATVSGSKYSYPDPEHQLKALDLILAMFGDRPAWLYPDSYSDKITTALPGRAGVGFSNYLVSELHPIMIYNLSPKMDKVKYAQRIFDKMMQQCVPGVAPDYFNRIMQGVATANLAANLSYQLPSLPQMGPTCRPIILYLLRQAQTKIKKALAAAPDEATRAHYTMLLQQVDDALKIE